ncbi:MAG TPA: hypothetical protein LFW21_01785 [Rickettsia endosymbiont of Pyrocoelia pectoralis]|nr:hypothetical protein [Rickettsia endosymbiont of Pyrocoelia pectoralis]
MLAIIAGLAGFLISFIPEFFNGFKDKKDKEHEIKLINLQIESAKTSQNSKLEAVRVISDMEESKYISIYPVPHKNKLIDGLWYALLLLIRSFCFMFI